MTFRSPAICLGGQDLEMETIRQWVATIGGLTVHDKHLQWGAKASDYAAEISRAIESQQPIALVELTLDMDGLDKHPHITIIDHHGARAGANQPSSLKQIWHWLGQMGTAPAWTREHDLISINDIAHIEGMIAFGATEDEIARIRQADRSAQGISQTVEEQSKKDLRAGYQKGPLWVVETKLYTSSAIADFAHPIFTDAPSPDNLLVFLPDIASFYGEGALIDRVKARPNCWFGGALPARGFWGQPAENDQERADILRILSS